MCMFCLYSCFILLNSLSGIEFTSTLKRKKKEKKKKKRRRGKKKSLFHSVLVCGVLLSFYPKVLFPHICIYQPF